MTADDTFPGPHPCPIVGCGWVVAHHRLMCPAHWRRVPADLQGHLYATWDHGRGEGTLEHVEAIAACIIAVENPVRALDPQTALPVPETVGRSPLDEPCTSCGVGVGEPCVTRNGTVTRNEHRARRRAASRLPVRVGGREYMVGVAEVKS